MRTVQHAEHMLRNSLGLHQHWAYQTQCQNRCSNRPYRDAQNKGGLERQDLPCTYLAHHEPKSIDIMIINIQESM